MEHGQVQGTLTVLDTLAAFDALILSGAERKDPFLLVIELKKGMKTVHTFGFDKCYVTRSAFSMDANGKVITEYAFTGAILRGENSPETGTGSSALRPKKPIK